MTPAVGVAAAVASAACFGVASAGQYAVVGTTVRRGQLDLRLLRDLASARAWWVTAGVEAAAVALQALAFRSASVVAVQALLVLGLPVAVLLAGRADRRTWSGLALTTGGIGVFAAAQHEVAAAPRPSLLLPLAVAAVAALLLVRRPRPAVAGALAGVVTGSAAVLLAATAAQPWHLVLVRPPLYAAAATGLLALQVGQAALRADRLGPPLAALTLAEPVAAIALAAAALHQPPHLPLLAVAAAVVAAAGVLVLQDPTHPLPHLETTP